MAVVAITPTLTLNGGSVDITVYEDTDGDGVANNSATATNVSSGSTYTLSGFAGGSGNDYWVKTSPSSSDPTNVPVVHDVDLTVPPDPPSSVSASVVGDGKIDLSWTDNSTTEDQFHIQVSRDGTNYRDPGNGAKPAGDADSGDTHTQSLYPASDHSYDQQIGIDSSFKFRIRAEEGSAYTDWVYSGTVYTTPIRPHDPLVNRPDGSTFEVSATVQSDIGTHFAVEVREDTGSGYGSWTWLDTFDDVESHTTGTWAKGNRITATFQTGTSYQGNITLSDNARYQFRIKTHDVNSKKNSEWAYCDYGNGGNVYFESDFENPIAGWKGHPETYDLRADKTHTGLVAAAKRSNNHKCIYRDDILDPSTTITASTWVYHESNSARYHGGTVLLDANLDGYAAYWKNDEDVVALYKVENGPQLSYTHLNEVTLASSPTTGVWYELELERASDGTLTASLYDDTGSLIDSVSTTDTTYTPDRPGLDSYDAGRRADNLTASDGAGNSYSNAFPTKWTSLSTGDPQSGWNVADRSGDLGVSGPDQGTRFCQIDGSGPLQKNLGDLSAESDVFVRCAFAIGSMDTVHDDTVTIEWYDGSAWQTIWEVANDTTNDNYPAGAYNRQGWFELHISVPDSYLSTDNRLRFNATNLGGGDHRGIDRVVVSDLLHEYTTPAAPSALSLDTSVEDEITVSWTDNAAFKNKYRADYKNADDSTYTANKVSASATSDTITGLDDGTAYDIDNYVIIWQDRRGESNTSYFHSSHQQGQATTLLPAPSSVSMDDSLGYDYTVSWVNEHDTGSIHVYISTDGGTTWTDDSGALSAATSYTTTAQSTVDVHDLKVAVETADAVTEVTLGSFSLAGAELRSQTGVLETNNNGVVRTRRH